MWFGDPSYFDYGHSEAWQTVAEGFGYSYQLWTEGDDARISDLFGTEGLEYIQYLRGKRRSDGASDVLRYFLLERFGGLYFDLVHRMNGALVDPANIWPLEGLVLSSESIVREVRNYASYVQNHIMMAAPHHPVMVALTQSLMENKRARPEQLQEWKMGAIFTTGQALLTRNIQGTFTMLWSSNLLAYGMHCWPDVTTYRAETRAKFKQRHDQPTRTRSLHVDR